MSWQYFPRRVWLTGFKPQPFIFLSVEKTDYPMGDVCEIRVNVDARPDGSFPDFPSGAFLQLYSVEVTIAGGGGPESFAQTAWDAIDLTSLSWSFVDGCWQSGIVKTFRPWGDVTVGSGESLEGKVMTIDVRESPEEASDQVFITDGWNQWPRGYSPACKVRDNHSPPYGRGMMSFASRKGVEIGGIVADFENTGTWYQSCTVTDSTDAAYVVGASFDPQSRPDGFTLTDQTAITRKWSKSDTDHFTVTLSGEWVFDPSNHFLGDGEEGNYFSQNCGDFVMTGVTDCLLGSQAVTFIESNSGNHAIESSQWPSSIGTTTFMTWSISGGYSSKTCTSAQEFSNAAAGYLNWTTGTFDEGEFPIMVTGKSGDLLRGIVSGTKPSGGPDLFGVFGLSDYPIATQVLKTRIPALTSGE